MENMNKNDLTNKENQLEFIRKHLGDELTKFLFKENIGDQFQEIADSIQIGMLYNEGETFDTVKKDFQVVEREGYGGHKFSYQKRTYLCNNLPTGKWNVIIPGVRNWPSMGEGGPVVYYVGVLDWNAETLDCKLTGIGICSESKYGIESIDEDEPIFNSPINGDECWYMDEVIIAWKDRGELMPARSSQMDWHSEKIMKMAIKKFVIEDFEDSKDEWLINLGL